MVQCDYAGCDRVSQEDEMEAHKSWDGVVWLACPACADKVIDDSGYCGMSCQFGHGCNHEC